jgi:hypothetical protein
MPKLPEPVHEHTTATAIVRWYDKQTDAPRPHLGASEIGKSCDRALWYSFRWATAKTFPGRIKRLFQRGHREEALFLEELRAIGVEVHEVDPDTKQQHRFSAHGGHFGGSCDAIARGLPEAPKTWAILEFKTHNAKSFAELTKQGVEKSKPEHFAQMQIYMGLAELDRALYLAVNKDTDELHSEWIHADAKRFEALMLRADKVISATEPLERVRDDPTWYECKWCDHFSACHENSVPQKNCRTCAYSTPVDGGWHCGLYDRALPYEEQRLGCRSHLFLPPLIPYAEPQDAGEGWVIYKHKADGKLFANTAEDVDPKTVPGGPPCYLSSELVGATAAFVTSDIVTSIKDAFDGRIVRAERIEE